MPRLRAFARRGSAAPPRLRTLLQRVAAPPRSPRRIADPRAPRLGALAPGRTTPTRPCLVVLPGPEAQPRAVAAGTNDSDSEAWVGQGPHCVRVCRLGGAASADPVNGPQAAGSRLSLSLPTRMCCFSQSSQRAAGRSGRRGRAAQAAGGAAAGGRKARSGGAGAGGREKRTLRGRAARAARGAAAQEAERRGRAAAARAQGRGPPTAHTFGLRLRVQGRRMRGAGGNTQRPSRPSWRRRQLPTLFRARSEGRHPGACVVSAAAGLAPGQTPLHRAPARGALAGLSVAHGRAGETGESGRGRAGGRRPAGIPEPPCPR